MKYSGYTYVGIFFPGYVCPVCLLYVQVCVCVCECVCVCVCCVYSMCDYVHRCVCVDCTVQYVCMYVYNVYHTVHM